MQKAFGAVEIERMTKSIEQRMAQAAEAKKKEPFPLCPDDRRGAPNSIIRSALFGVVKRGRRIMLKKHELPAPSGWKLYYTGQRLDQTDLDIWLEIMHRARGTVPGTQIRFTFRSVLHALKHIKDGHSGYVWLKDRLEGMTLGGFSYENESQAGATGSLFRKFAIDEITREGIVETNQDLRSLYDNITYLDFANRLALRSQLSKWLHALISSHAQWMPTKVATLMGRSGVSYARLRDFRSHLRTSLQELQEHRIIQSWEIDIVDLLHIQKSGTPSQQRYLTDS